MGIKLVAAEAFLLPLEYGHKAVEVGDTVDVSKDDAATLARIGRAYYLSPEDDATKGSLTATAERAAVIKARAKGIAAERAAAAAKAPLSQADAIAAAVAAALAAAGIRPQAEQVKA